MKTPQKNNKRTKTKPQKKERGEDVCEFREITRIF
jgi:hypothetical protein